MSEQVLSTLITAGAVILSSMLTLVLTQWLNLKSQSQQAAERRSERRDDYREWYRRTLFEKRLAAVQEAHAWLMKFNVAINNADRGNPASEANEVLRQAAKEAREWYDNNAIYIHDQLPQSSEFVGLTNVAFQYANGMIPAHDSKDRFGVWNFYLAASKMIKERARKLLELESEHQQANDQ